MEHRVWNTCVRWFEGFCVAACVLGLVAFGAWLEAFIR